jgi:hypothetical protein
MSTDPNHDEQTKKKSSSNRRVVDRMFSVCGLDARRQLRRSAAFELFCQVTGYGGTIQRTEQLSDKILDRTVKVRFDANTARACLGISSRFSAKSKSASARQFSSPTPPRTPLTYRPPARRHSMSRRWRPAPISTRFSASASPKPNSSPARRWKCRSCSSSIRRSLRLQIHKTSTQSPVLHFLPARNGKTRCGGGSAGARQQ